jgi:uncharacterized protein
MIDSRHATDILDVKSCRGADCDGDHCMVKIKYRERVSIIGKSSAQRSIKYNVENLKEGTNAKEYRNKVEEILQTLPNTEDQHVEAAWEDIKQTISKAADNILGQKPRMERYGWCDEECKEILYWKNRVMRD